MNVGLKITPGKFLADSKEKEGKTFSKDGKKASTSWTTAKLLEMIAWYLVPAIYIIFTVAYFAIYGVM